MLLRVQHQILYAYSEPVTLDPHVLYLYPRTSPFVEVTHFDLQIEPKPSLVVRNLDAEGNAQYVAYFGGSIANLSISMMATVRNTLTNPFEFILYPFSVQNLPFSYEETLKTSLSHYLTKEGVTAMVEQFARQIASKAKWSTLQFLLELNQYILENFSYEIRDEGAPKPAEYTLRVRKGSCRDFVVLFMAVCRAVGLAARFVSGYHYGNPDEVQYLHAWAEVYLPGAGWRGYDPTQNCLTAHTHIPLAAAAVPEQVTPVAGVYRGAARSNLLTAVRVSELS